MVSRENAFLRHQRQRWLRPDAARWLMPDIARYLRPGSSPAEAGLLIERKYNPNQPRVPAGNPDGGQWTDGGGGGLAARNNRGPSGPTDSGGLPISNDVDALFQISPQEIDRTGNVQLAGDPPGIGHNQGPPLEPPEIPAERPETGADRMKVVRDIARWSLEASRIVPVLDIISVATAQAEWLKSYSAAMKSYSDPPKSLEELQSRAGESSEPGYENHHIEERTLLRRLGFAWRQINDPSNVARIPILKHYEISGWYGRPNDEFGGLSPRDYLRDKDSIERRRVGLDALVRFGVLKP